MGEIEEEKWKITEEKEQEEKLKRKEEEAGE